jgi:hypothetical protein
MTGAAPPDDRLREAIHSFFAHREGLFRRKGSPLRKRFAFVADNDDVEVLVICPTG